VDQLERVEGQLRRAGRRVGQALLRKSGYDGMVIGFAWDGFADFATGPRFKEMQARADLSALFLRMAIQTISIRCQDAKINILTHSLGARVMFEALLGGMTVDSVQLVSAAVDNEVLGADEDYGGSEVLSRAGNSIHNWYLPWDFALNEWYRLSDLDRALGLTGFEDRGNVGNGVTQASYERLVTADAGPNGRTRNPNDPSLVVWRDHSAMFYSPSLVREIARRLK
jgi:hypothetical protein